MAKVKQRVWTSPSNNALDEVPQARLNSLIVRPGPVERSLSLIESPLPPNSMFGDIHRLLLQRQPTRGQGGSGS